MDKIVIRNLKLFAYHGVNPEEKENGQNFFIDIDAFADIKKACKNDDLNSTVNYAKIIKTLRRVFTENKYDLIEKAAQTVVDAIFDEHPKIQKIRILLKKPEAPVKADFDYVGVELERTRNNG